MTEQTIRRDRLATQDTATLVAQYELAISSNRGRYSNYGPRQKRIDYLVDLIAARDDAVADAFLTIPSA